MRVLDAIVYPDLPECSSLVLQSLSAWRFWVFICGAICVAERTYVVRLAPVRTANRVGVDEMGTPADGVVPFEVGARLHYQGAPVRILLLLDSH